MSNKLRRKMAIANREDELGPPQGTFAGTDAIEAIKFAVEIDGHYERLEFLKGYIEGDLREWPEFKPAIAS